MSNDDRAEPYWDSVASSWERDHPQRLWRLHSDAVNSRLIGAWLPRSDIGRLIKTDAFDEAVSEGIMASLRTRCRHAVATDVSKTILRAANERVGCGSFVAGDARSLPFATGSFDAVVSLSTLDHFRSEAELLTSLGELRRICAPGAHLVLTMDNPANPLIGLRGALPFSWLQRTGLVPYFVGTNLGPDRFRAAVAQSGFEVDELAPVMHAPRVVAIALGRLLDRRAGDRSSQWWLRFLMGFERLSRWPTRFRTAHFLAVRATAI